MTTAIDGHRLAGWHCIARRMILILFVLGWTATAATGSASADDEDDETSSSGSTSSNIVETWPPTDVAWPPQLSRQPHGGTDADSDPTASHARPGGAQPSVTATMPLTPTDPISPIVP